MKKFALGNPYTSEVNLDVQKDEFLVIASDGLWDAVRDDYCCRFIKSNLAEGITDPDVIAKALGNLAMNSCTDNISVVVVLFNFEKKQCEEAVNKKAKVTNHDDEDHESSKDEEDEDGHSSDASENSGKRRKSKRILAMKQSDIKDL